MDDALTVNVLEGFQDVAAYLPRLILVVERLQSGFDDKKRGHQREERNGDPGVRVLHVFFFWGGGGGGGCCTFLFEHI